jgi:hypothetical protein
MKAFTSSGVPVVGGVLCMLFKRSDYYSAISGSVLGITYRIITLTQLV